MKRIALTCLLLLCLPLPARAETNLTFRLNDLDPAVLELLGQIDLEQLQTICRDVYARFQNPSVSDLAELKESAAALLQILDENDETKPYAAWLRARMEYLTVANEFKTLAITPPHLELPLSDTNLPPLNPVPVPLLNPSANVERAVWVKQLRQAPMPVRAAMYVAKLKKTFRAEGLPAELVWVAEVESQFDPQARSPVGAAGLFQLMPETAKSLGLRLSPKDERLDPGKSAQASARYWKYLYGKFNDWRLTIAAYNAGEGRVRRLLDKLVTKSYDDIAIYLPAETQMYVPKVEATIQRREGVALPDIKRPGI